MDWNRMRDQIGWALTGVESYEHREARLSEDTPERILQDLIAELRKEPVQCSDPYCSCPDCPQEWILTEADRAEQRLQEAQGE